MIAEPSGAEAEGRPERWLRSRPRRLAIALSVAVLVALAMTFLRTELAWRRGPPDAFGRVFLRQLLFWSAWALASEPLFALARWLLARLRNWYLFLAVELPLSLGVVYLFVWLSRITGSLFHERPYSRRFDRFSERVADPWDPPDLLSPLVVLRLPFELLVYWIVLATGGTFHSYLRKRSEERRAALLELEAARLEGELAHAQVDSLRRQLHPHFLFNALHTVGGLIRKGERDRALRALSSLGDMLRRTLDLGEEQEVRLADELRTARDYLGIEGIRFEDRLAVDVDAPAETLDALVPALLLLPLVENAVRHGVAPRTEGGWVRVTARREGDELVLRVDDDGAGFDERALAGEEPTQLDGRRRIGLANCRQRLAMLYGSAHVFETRNRPEGGASVLIRLPWRTGAPGVHPTHDSDV